MYRGQDVEKNIKSGSAVQYKTIFFPPILPTPIPQQVSCDKVKISSREEGQMSIAKRLNSIFSYLNSVDSLHNTSFIIKKAIH